MPKTYFRYTINKHHIFCLYLSFPALLLLTFSGPILIIRAIYLLLPLLLLIIPFCLSWFSFTRHHHHPHCYLPAHPILLSFPLSTSTSCSSSPSLTSSLHRPKIQSEAVSTLRPLSSFEKDGKVEKRFPPLIYPVFSSPHLTSTSGTRQNI